MDHLILGLLLLRSRTIYELQQAVSSGLNLMYSSSLGSIQAAIRKLLAENLITSTEIQQGNRLKKLYTISDAGRKAFSDWVETPINAAAARHPELGKLFFMGFSDPAVRRSNIQAVIDGLQQPYAVLCQICREAETMEVPPEARDILHYQAASAQFGRDFMKFQIDWYQTFLKEEEAYLK